MGGLFLILIVVAFDLWLLCNIGWWKLSGWRAQKMWRHIALAASAGLLLALWLAFFIKYSYGTKLRAEGFPIPVVFFHLDGETWTRTTLTAPLRVLGVGANILTGLAAPFVPFKIIEFLKLVKAEMK